MNNSVSRNTSEIFTKEHHVCKPCPTLSSTALQHPHQNPRLTSLHPPPRLLSLGRFITSANRRCSHHRANPARSITQLYQSSCTSRKREHERNSRASEDRMFNGHDYSADRMGRVTLPVTEYQNNITEGCCELERFSLSLRIL